MPLAAELERIAALAAAFADPGEALTGVLAAEPDIGTRVYVCAFERGDEHAWLVLDEEGRPIESRSVVRDAATVAALCEIAEETAGGGDLAELRSQLVTLRLTENPPGIDEAEDAALALEHVLGTAPRVATPAYLDAVGTATRRLERALGDDAGSPFAAALQAAAGAVEELAAEVVARHKRPLA